MHRTVEVTRGLDTPAVTAGRVIADATAAVMGGAQIDDGTYRVALHVNGRNGSVQHDGHITITNSGAASDGCQRWTLTIAPVGGTRILPHFDGVLSVRGDNHECELVLAGTYRPPLGPVGAFGDGLLGHRLARQSLQRFLDEVADRIEQHAGSLTPATSATPPASVTENWLG